MTIETKRLRPELWKDLENLFGQNGACGGCWCMSWRRTKGENWEDMKGYPNKKRFKRLVVSGMAHGVLAYDEGEPIGWCSFDRRQDYSKLDRSPSLKCDDSAEVWSIPCFFIKKDYRGQGVGTLLLSEAVKAIKDLGGKIAEGYPTKPYNYGNSIPAAFAWTGTNQMFKKLMFKPVGKKDGSKQRMRLSI